MMLTLGDPEEAASSEQLPVDGQLAVEGALPAPLEAPEGAGLKLGADPNGAVLGGPESPRLLGLIESLRIHSGVAP